MWIGSPSNEVKEGAQAELLLEVVVQIDRVELSDGVRSRLEDKNCLWAQGMMANKDQKRNYLTSW